MERMSGIMIFGIVLIAAGILGFAVPVFTTQQTEEVVKISDLKLQSTVETNHHIPQILSGGAVVLGLILLGTGISRKR